MRDDWTWCSLAVRSERRKGVWWGANRWSGRRPIRSISFPAQRCHWRSIARGRSREAALAALREAELTWEIVYTSSSLTGVRAAALAGLAIAPLPESAVIAGLRILDAKAGLPRLPDLELAIYEKPRPDKAAAALAAAMVRVVEAGREQFAS
jgi:DNA-binding transcriptional LysR family regulator